MLPRGLTQAELAGGFGLPGAVPVTGRIEDSFARQMAALPDQTRQLLQLAAADPTGDQLLVWRAAGQLGIPVEAAASAVEAGLVEFGGRVRFRHPLVRSVAYQSASFAGKQQLHAALARATDPIADPDRRAWHRAQAAPGPDEQVAAELERSAGRAQARGGLAAAAAFLERAVALTDDPARRAGRTLAAAQACLQAGAFDSTRALLDVACAGPVDELQRARIDLLRARLAFALSRGNDAPSLLLAAARRLESLDLELARETYVDAFIAAMFGARLTEGIGVRDVAQAARGGHRPVRGGAGRHRHRPPCPAAGPARVRPGLRRQHRAHRHRRPGPPGIAMCTGPTTAGDIRAAIPHPVSGTAADPITLQPADDVVITTLVDNVYDALLTSGDTITRAPLAAGTARAPQFEPGRTSTGLMAEHGFSALVTVRRGGTTTSVLFDTGLSPDAMITNAARLGLDLSAVHAVVLSHGHFDHAGGLAGLAGRRGPRSLPMIIHPLAWTRRRLARPGGGADDWPALSKHALAGEGFDVIERRQPSLLLDGSLLITGEVDRTTGFEHGMPPAHQHWTGTTWEPDPLILDDQALVANVRGQGLVIVTGCGHASAVNIVRHAQRLTGVPRLHALLGGLHLSGAYFTPAIAPTVRALTELAPHLLVPGHCTGWRAQHALAAALPGSWIQGSSGTGYHLTADRKPRTGTDQTDQ